MGLLDSIPSADQFAGVLAGVIGDEAAGTGVAGALKLLRDVDTAGSAGALTSGLERTFAAVVPADAAALTADALGPFRQLVDALPADPAQLVAPLDAALARVRHLATTEAADRLAAGIGGLDAVRVIAPADPTELLTEAADGILRLKDEFIAGGFAELRRWSAEVQGLHDELAPLFAAGSEGIEDRLIVFLETKMADLARIVLPGGQSLATERLARIEAAISPERVAAIGTLKSEIVDRLHQARAAFDQGDFTNTTHLLAAQTGFAQLTTELGGVLLGLRTVVDDDGADADGLAAALQRQLDAQTEVEIVDLGNIRDAFVGAIDGIEAAIREVRLDAVRDAIGDVFGRIDGVLAEIDPPRLQAALAGLEAEAQAALADIDGALFAVVATLRARLTDLRQALREVTSALGSYDEAGRFRFHLQQEIESVLDGIRSTLDGTVRPLLEEFRGTVGQTLRQVEATLAAVTGEIDGAVAQLRAGLESTRDRLRELDVPGKLAEIRQRLEAMLDALGTIDFDPVVDPVVAQIDEMRDQLKAIDLSALNDVLVEGLHVSARVVLDLDFAGQVKQALLDEVDALLERPTSALQQIETSAEDALAVLRRFEPRAILAPLDDVFAPVSAELARLELSPLTEPIAAWHRRAQEELAKVAPAALLQPVLDVHAELTSAVASISPETLVQPLQDAIAAVNTELQQATLPDVAAALGEAVNRAQGLIDELAPDRLLAPLIDAFDKIVAALDGFDPGGLLAPFASVFDQLAAPLDHLTGEHIRLIGLAFAPLRALPEAFDPRQVFQAVAAAYAAALALLAQLNVGRIISDLKAPHDTLRASFQAAGGAYPTVQAAVEALDPLRATPLNQVAAGFQEVAARLQGAFPAADPPAALVERYEAARPRLDLLVPSWVTDGMTPASVKRAFLLANPAAIAGEVTRIYDAAKAQIVQLDPRVIQQELQATADSAKAAIAAFDPQAITAAMVGMVDGVTRTLDAIDLALVTTELRGLVDEIDAVIAGLDPHSIVQQLTALTAEVEGLIAALDPVEILAELNEPLAAARATVATFDPAVLATPLLEAFDEIREVIAQIDVGPLLEPLVDRLAELRGELAAGLDRTEAAFERMVAAIPVSA